MKLELKHLAPYLPYGIKALEIHSKKIGTISNIYTIGDGYDNEDIKLSINHFNGEHIWMFKPIIRPLSDLSKEIEVNGERFVLSDRLYYDFDRHGLNGFDFRDIEKTPLEYPFNIVQKLLEWHFDVFGLIELGLAIDINTLKP